MLKGRLALIGAVGIILLSQNIKAGVEEGDSFLESLEIVDKFNKDKLGSIKRLYIDKDDIKYDKKYALPKNIEYENKEAIKAVKKNRLNLKAPLDINSKSKKILYLTFDDGPLKGSENVIKVIEGEGVVATMFLIGRHIKFNKKLYQLEVSSPNLLLGNHSYTHANNHFHRFYIKKNRSLKDIDKSQKIIKGAKFLRLPGRNVWRIPDISVDDYGLKMKYTLKEQKQYNKLYKMGYYIYGWDVEWHYDSKNGEPIIGVEELVKRVERVYREKRSKKEGKIILLAHDFMFKKKENMKKLKKFIQIMKKRGWSFQTIDQYCNDMPDVLATKRKRTIKEEGVNILNLAIRQNDTRAIEALLKSNVDVNSLDKYGILPLNLAIQYKREEIVKDLILNGANLYAKDRRGITPYKMLKFLRRKAIFAMIKKILHLDILVKNSKGIKIKRRKRD